MTLKELTEKRDELIARAQELVDTAELQTRDLSEDEKSEFDSINEQVEAIKEQIKNEENNTDKGVEKNMENKELEVRSFQEQQFVNFLTNTPIEQRADAPFVYTDNSAVVPTSVVNKIIDQVYNMSPIIEKATKYRIKGDLVVPYYTTSTNVPNDVTAGYITEFTPPDATAGKISGVTLTDFVIMAFTLVSKRLLTNGVPDTLTFLIEKTAFAVKKFVEGQIINGTVGKITGLSTATNTKTTAVAGTVTADEIIECQDLVADQYQENAIWIMAPSTRTVLRTMKDGQNNYLLQRDYTTKWNWTLLGKPVYCSDAVESLAASKRFIFYGDFSQALAGKISEEMNMQILREAYATKHGVGILCETAVDYKVVNQAACSVLVSHA